MTNFEKIKQMSIDGKNEKMWTEVRLERDMD